MDRLFRGSGLQKSEIQMLAGLAPFWSLAQLGGGHCWYTLVFLGGWWMKPFDFSLSTYGCAQSPLIKTPAIGLSVCLNPF